MRALMVLLLSFSAHAQIDWGTPIDFGEPIDWGEPLPVTLTTHEYGDIKVTEIVDQDGNREALTTYEIGDATITQGRTVDCVTYGNITQCK